MDKPQYWRPAPQPRGFAFWSLLIPASIYVLGTIVYGAEAMKAGQLLIGDGAQSIGSALMVVGGEMGTIAAACEVFRKAQQKRTNLFDWTGIVVSLLATLGTLFVIFARQTDIAATWVTLARTYGPLALLLCSGLDFYATTMELGFYLATFEERWHEWNDKRHSYETRGPRLISENAEISADLPPEPQEFVGGIAEWRRLAAKFDGRATDLTARGVNEFLEAQGFAPVAESTARYWANDASSRRNGHKVAEER